MNKKLTSNQLVNKTDWKRVDAMKDNDIIFDEDSPRTNAKDWEEAIVHKGLPFQHTKIKAVLSLDNDVLV